MQHKIILILFIILINFACEKIKYYSDDSFIEVKTKILAHRGGGENYSENTYNAAEYGFSSTDGIEVDLQISKDATIWLSHNSKLESCGGIDYDCFSETYDYEINQLDSCMGDSFDFTKLEDIFEMMSERFNDKYISLDVKAWIPCKPTSIGIIGMMNLIADEIIRLTKKYNLQNHVMVESETATFLNYIKRNSTGIECYLTSFGDFERAMQLSLEAKYTGISFKYKSIEEITSSHIQMIRRNNLKIQLWTVNTEDDIKEAIAINPDFIQTDNVDYFTK